MSGYVKGQEGNLVYGYGATRPNPDQSYAAFTQPSYSSTFTDAPARAPHEPFLGSQYEPRDTTYQQQYPNIIGPPSQNLPEIISFLPTKATHGQKLSIRLRSKYDLTVPSVYRFFVMYYQKRCEATLSKLDQTAPYFNYGLESEIPPFDTTGCLESQVPLMLNMEDEYGQSLGVVEVGDFTYETLENYPAYHAQNKRKRSGSEDPARSPAKRASQPNLRGSGRSNSSAYYTGQNLPASPPTPNFASVPSYYAQYGQRTPSTSYSQVSGLTSSVQPQMIRMPASSYSPYTGVSPPTRSPASIVGTPIGKSVMPSSNSSGAPTLVRTSTIQPTATPTPGTNPHSFNPYAMYPNSKAVLKIDGDLDKMVEHWSDEEWNVKRRLVQFRRSQTGSTIIANFSPVTPEARSPHSICISCIWWEEKQECFVTSVDTIYLLESLVAVRFTVEEKNRIRRNLEGFRPLTVSKLKADSEDFFKIIMGFPNPKPRNIEKDVKVFPWKILAHALKKIISKYSASYSSTAGALSSTVSYGGGSMAEAGTNTHYAMSRRHSSISGAPTLYQSSVTSPSMRGSAGPGRLSAGPQDMRASSVSQAGWQTAQHATPQYPGSLSSYGRGATIDYAAFLTEPGVHDQSANSHHAPPQGGVEHGSRQRGSMGSSVGDYKLAAYGHGTSQA